jgi:hypothetical protein
VFFVALRLLFVVFSETMAFFIIFSRGEIVIDFSVEVLSASRGGRQGCDRR